MVADFFQLQSHRTTLKTEAIAGCTTFLTMAYIILVNPDILATTGMDKSALIAVTCFVTGIVTIATGLLANAPIAMAPGMGLNAFFAYTLVLNKQISWQTALGAVFLSGLFFLILTLLGLRKKSPKRFLLPWWRRFRSGSDYSSPSSVFRNWELSSDRRPRWSRPPP